MAEIELRRERGRSIWPWIVGALALVLLVWGVTEFMGTDDEDFVATTAEEQAATTPAQPPPDAAMPMELTRFEQQCSTAATVDVEQCIGQLGAALDAVARRDPTSAAISTQLQEHRTHADGLAADTASSENAARVGELFDEAAALIRSVEESRAGTAGAVTDVSASHADRVQEAADAFDADLPLDGQREVVDRFFSEAASALRALATG
ncbi:MAG: hypothetical protein WEF86_10750 [Gemmatimonadota bacterium]